MIPPPPPPPPPPMEQPLPSASKPKVNLRREEGAPPPEQADASGNPVNGTGVNPMSSLPLELQDAPRNQQLHYVTMLEDGRTNHSPSCAVSSSHQPQKARTEPSWKETNAQWLDDMPKFQADRMLREAKQAGINTTGKFYMSGLAQAWCSRPNGVD